MKAIWMKITKDEYELPLAVAESATDLARMLGVSVDTIYSATSRRRNHGDKTAFIKVEVKDDFFNK